MSLDEAQLQAARPRLDAEAKASGAVQYTADLAPPGTLFGAVARSTRPHARIRSIDISAAANAAGVVGVYTAADVSPGTFGRQLRDSPILARDKVRFVGEKVAAVVASSRQLAEQAAALIEIEYEDLPAVTTIDAALAPGAPLVHEHASEYPGAAAKLEDAPNVVAKRQHGDREAVEQMIAASAFSIDQTYTLSSVHQGYLEPQACIADWSAEGELHVWITNKSPYPLRSQLSACLSLEPEKINIHPAFIGGDFGGKGSPEDSPLVAELARLTGSPVKMVLRFSEDLTATNPRSRGQVRVRIGCDVEARIQALALDVTLDSGAYGGYAARAAGPTGITITPYRVPNFYYESRRVYTNTVPRGHMRAPGSPQGSFAVESALDELAAAVGIDPIEMRRRNLLTDGEVTAEGEVWAEHRGIETLQAATSNFVSAEAPEGWLRGTGVAIFAESTRFALTSLRIVPKDDGCVRVELPITETGTGSHTVARELVARGLGLNPEQVEVVQVTSADLPGDVGAGGSRVTANIAVAVDAAVKDWQSRLDHDTPVTVSLSDGEGPVGSYCVQLAQVAVDPATGQVAVLEILSAVDVAEIVNPKAHQMQIDGGVMMGFGYALLEDLAESEGQVWAANLGEFKIPSVQDAPVLKTVLVRGGRGVGTANIKNIGELVNSSVAPAIVNAVAAATGCRIRQLPLTAERVYMALRESSQP